ncbi:hypothetical protein C2S53_018911 [Perilla frutescens var. hirtella]|uniref:TFIIS N-terminal domain-containing protein n=1 Tax=Perilla frutescens var. hirtella TaxID=608512 RepID=A0AAD4NYW0_PERFH|nr:hypothetical protein C2S53_018911 [Perilla frutescens var. hirtella]
MAKNPVGLDTWRDYFRSSNSDIFSVIEHAIMVAASDCPYDFKAKRDGIAELLFTCGMSLNGIDGDEEFKTGGSKDSEVNEKNRVGYQEDYDHDLEGVSDEIEEESHDQILEEIVRIKGVIDESAGKSTEVLLESLRRLQSMPLSVQILKSTLIGKSVYALRNHGSKEIRNLGRRLVVEWRRVVYNALAAEETKSDIVEEEEEEEEEEEAFLGDSKESTMKTEAPNAGCRQPNSDNVVKVQQNGTLIQKKPLPQQQEADKLNRVNETVSEQMRLEAAKRKLHQRYQEAENAKKRRMIQVVELRDLPKQSLAHRNQQMRPAGSHHSRRQPAHGRW